MIEFDSNGIALDASGSRIYKRYAEFILDGKRVMGGVYTGQSTSDELLVDVHALASVLKEGAHTAETWRATGQLVHVHQSHIVRVFEPRVNDPAPSLSLESVDDLARFILKPDSTDPTLIALRMEIVNRLKLPLSAKGYTWSMMPVGIIRGMPEARALFADKPRSYDQVCIACKVLDRAVAILRGTA